MDSEERFDVAGAIWCIEQAWTAQDFAWIEEVLDRSFGDSVVKVRLRLGARKRLMFGPHVEEVNEAIVLLRQQKDLKSLRKTWWEVWASLDVFVERVADEYVRLAMKLEGKSDDETAGEANARAEQYRRSVPMLDLIAGKIVEDPAARNVGNMHVTPTRRVAINRVPIKRAET